MFTVSELIDIRYALKGEIVRFKHYMETSDNEEHKKTYSNEIKRLQALIDKVKQFEG